MNIIPLVTTFIIIMGLFGISQMQNIKYLSQETRVFEVKQDLLKQFRIDMAKTTYNNLKHNHEFNRDGILNLKPLIKNPHDATLFKHFITCIYNLYPNSNRDQLASLFKSIINSKDFASFNKLELKDEELQKLLNILLEGSSTAPPLLEVVHITTSNTKIFKINALSDQLISAFFQGELAKSITAIQELSLKQFKTLLNEYKTLSIDEITAFIDFSAPKQSEIKRRSQINKKTGLKLVRNEPY